MRNPYIPYAVRISKIVIETSDKLIKSFDLVFLSKEDEKNWHHEPGQFAELSVFGKGEIPIGIASSPTEKGFLRFTVMKVGLVTTALHEMEEGEEIGVRGPLGNWYSYEKMKGGNIVIIGGGFAFTTLRAFTKFLLHPSNRKDFGNITVIYGARSPGLLLYKEELTEWEKRDDLSLFQCIDWKIGPQGPIEEPAAPGWNPVNMKEPSETAVSLRGGKFTAFVPQMVDAASPSSKNAFAIICGPPIMIKFTLPVVTKLGFSPENIINSLEMRMKCGIGKCGRCNIGNKYVCKDGPVFTLAQLQTMPKEY
jgi:NAD(P)H-flavin reductase